MDVNILMDVNKYAFFLIVSGKYASKEISMQESSTNYNSSRKHLTNQCLE